MYIVFVCCIACIYFISVSLLAFQATVFIKLELSRVEQSIVMFHSWLLIGIAIVNKKSRKKSRSRLPL